MTFRRRQHPNPAREQWDRCERWYARFELARARETDVEDYALVVLHHCWTMHDWLIRGLHDQTPVSTMENAYSQKEVEGLFQSPELQACRLFSNVAKHLDAHKIPAGSNEGTIIRNLDGQRRVATLTARADGEHDLLGLCEKSMAQIRAFLEAHGWQLPGVRLVPEIVPC